jgi:hypothetical protein
MKKGFTKVIAADKIRTGRCHGKRAGRVSGPNKASYWRLWLECGHIEKRNGVNPPRSIKCDKCIWEKKFGVGHTKQFVRGGIPDNFTVIRF